MCNQFAHFFNNKVNSLVKETCNTIKNKDIKDIFEHISTSKTFKTFPFLSKQTLRKIIRNFSTKLCSMDPIPTTFLKSFFDVLFEPIATIVNGLLKSGSCSSNWKTLLKSVF